MIKSKMVLSLAFLKRISRKQKTHDKRTQFLGLSSKQKVKSGKNLAVHSVGIVTDQVKV